MREPWLNKPLGPAPPTGSTLLPPAGWSSGVCKRARGPAGRGVAVPATAPAVRDCSPEAAVLGRPSPAAPGAESSAHLARGPAGPLSAGRGRVSALLGATLKGQTPARSPGRFAELGAPALLPKLASILSLHIRG